MQNKKRLNLQAIVTSAFGMGIALFLGAMVPSRLGYAIARLLAQRVARRKDDPTVRAVRLNQWVVRGMPNAAELDSSVEQVFQSQGLFLFDFYHNLRRPKKILQMVQFSPAFKKLLEQCSTGSHPALFVSPHVGPIDLAGYAIALHGLPVQLLSYPQVNSGYAWQNLLRRRQGLNITPISQSSLTQARILLQHGGTVLTGLDRPNPGSGYSPRFFGRPAELPVFYVRLALKTSVPVYVVTVCALPDGKYLMDCSEPVIMRPYTDAHTEIVSNAERILEIGARFIAQHPDQWSMFYPVWPELMEQVP
jgi:KDO2-lipid IV(A) lauroyltransferase